MKKLLLTFSFLFVSCCVFAQQYTINTFAGNGFGTPDTGYFAGDGGPATAAELYGPYGVNVDKYGNVYVADQYNNRIRKINTAGVISTIAGNGKANSLGNGGLATAAGLNAPAGICIDDSGNVFIAEYMGDFIRKVNTQGIISTIAGFDGPVYNGDNILATTANLSFPTGVAVDNSGNVYIADQDDYRLRKVNRWGIITTIVGNGKAGYFGDGGQGTAAELYRPNGVITDAVGNIYISDGSNNRIRKLNTQGIISTVAGNGFGAPDSGGYSGDGGQATAAELYYPIGVAVDNVGNLFIADISNNRIRKVTTNGTISTIAGDGIEGYSGDGGMATNAELGEPFGVAVDGAGNVYIGDVTNDRIRKLTLVTGINELSNTSSVNLYPDPNKGIFNLQLKTNNYSKAIVSIYNVLGARVASSLLEPGIVSQPGGQGWAIDISNQPAGIYLYRITDETGELIATGKFVIE